MNEIPTADQLIELWELSNKSPEARAALAGVMQETQAFHARRAVAREEIAELKHDEEIAKQRLADAVEQLARHKAIDAALLERDIVRTVNSRLFPHCRADDGPLTCTDPRTGQWCDFDTLIECLADGTI